MRSLFIDSSALFAWGAEGSREAIAIKEFMIGNQFPLFSTNFILAETLSLITKRVGKTKGITFGEQLLSSKIIHFIGVDDHLQKEAWQLYKQYKDKDFDLIDATSFVYCRKHKIKEVITLDAHFSQMGFTVIPWKSLSCESANSKIRLDLPTIFVQAAVGA